MDGNMHICSYVHEEKCFTPKVRVLKMSNKIYIYIRGFFLHTGKANLNM